jgi:hypothetical protein
MVSDEESECVTQEKACVEEGGGQAALEGKSVVFLALGHLRTWTGQGEGVGLHSLEKQQNDFGEGEFGVWEAGGMDSGVRTLSGI